MSIYWEFWIICVYQINHHLCLNNNHWLEGPWRVLPPLGIILRKHFSMKDMPSSTSTLRFSMLWNKACTCRSLMRMNMNNVKIPSMLAPSRFVVRTCCDSVDFRESFLSCTKKVLIDLFGVSTCIKYTHLCEGGIWYSTYRNLDAISCFEKKDVTSYKPSPSCTLKTHCPVDGSQVLVFALASGLASLLLSASINVVLPFFVWGVFDESLCFTSENTASCGKSDGANFTVISSFASSASKEVVLQTS